MILLITLNINIITQNRGEQRGRIHQFGAEKGTRIAQNAQMATSSGNRSQRGNTEAVGIWRSNAGTDDVGAIERALGERSMWHQWMMSHYDSYRERYSQAPAYGLTSAVIRTRYELSDVMTLQERVERDAVDGRLDDPALKAEYIQQLKEAQAAIIQTLEELK